jgi:hypothetical protein
VRRGGDHVGGGSLGGAIADAYPTIGLGIVVAQGRCQAKSLAARLTVQARVACGGGAEVVWRCSKAEEEAGCSSMRPSSFAVPCCNSESG